MRNLELNDEHDEIRASGAHGYILLYLDNRPSMRWRFYKSMKLKFVWESTKNNSVDKEIAPTLASKEKVQPPSYKESSPLFSDIDEDEKEHDFKTTTILSPKGSCAKKPISPHFQSEISQHEVQASFSETFKAKTNSSLVETSENGDFDEAFGSDAEKSMCDKPETGLILNSLNLGCRYCGKLASNSEEEEDAHYRSLSCFIPCLKCQKEFSNQGELLMHQLQNHSWEFVSCHYPDFDFDKPSAESGLDHHDLNKCPLCCEVFSDATSVTDHISTMHFSEELYRCCVCGVSKNSKSVLLEHLRTAHNPDIKLPQDGLTNAYDLHMQGVSVEEAINPCLAEPTKFDACGLIPGQSRENPIINTENKLTKDIDHDNKSKQSAKPKASGSVKRKSAYQKHHSKICVLCKETYGSRAVHYKPNPPKFSKCPICNRNFNSQAALIVHKHVIHSNKKPETRDGTTTGLVLNKANVIPWCKRVYSCPLCSRKICYPRLIEHVKDQHTMESCFSCCLCKKEFSRWFMLQDHINTHHGIENSRGKWHCSRCPEVFSNNNDFLRHSHIHRQVCVFCNKDFKFSRLLNIHYHKEHYDSLFSCKICGHRVATERQLWTHERYHKYKNPLPCHICGKLFRGSFLKRHIQNSHRDKASVLRVEKIKKFMCSMCPQTFYTEGYLIRHMTTTHKQKIGHQCPLCPKLFVSREKAREHVRKHTLEAKLK